MCSLTECVLLAIKETFLCSLFPKTKAIGPLSRPTKSPLSLSWWQGKGHGEARFTADGRVRFTWPTDPEDPNGEAMDPFAAFGMSIESLGWQLLMEGRVVQMVMDGYGGPQELVCRHPVTWGWILYSGGTCWTSWPMPACEEVEGVKMCSDPLLREGMLCMLPTHGYPM